jgi:protease-4
MNPSLTRLGPVSPSAVREKLAAAVEPDRLLLELDLSRGLLEAPPSDPLSAVRARRIPTLRTLVEQLHRAAKDRSVQGLIAHVGAATLTAAQAQELGEAVEAFAASGRPTLCWTESFGELGGGTAPYLLAAYFDQVWLQPSGSLGLLGVSAYGLFVRDALDRLGIEPEFGQRHEYKNAADLFLRSSMSDAHREALQQLADSTLDQIVGTTTRRRGLSGEAVRSAIDAGPLTAQQALAAGLVDRLGYRDEAYADLRQQLAPDGQLRLRYVERWSPGPVKRIRERAQRQPTIAVVPVVGSITVGRSGSSPLQGTHSGSDTVTAALRAAEADDGIRAVVLRVVSPGGSYVSSDAIRRQVLRLRESGCPVVASMGSVAASGGYFVSMPCDEVVAEPTTITGSIGVLGGKLVIRDALHKAGIGLESVTSGEHAGMFSTNRRFDQVEWDRVDEWLDAVYADFTAKAASDRGMALDELEPIARGRVWTGADALRRGLVDQMGGLRTAVTRAAELAEVDAERVRLRTLPHLTPINRLRPPSSSESPAAASAGASLGGDGVEALIRTVWSVVFRPVGGALTLPGHWELH